MRVAAARYASAVSERADPLTFRRALRRSATEQENLLWRALRGRQFAGAKFRRQHTVGPYTLDFICTGRRLGIELDGGGHYLEPGRARDATRDAWLAAQGIRVLRFSNEDVRINLDGVLEAVWAALNLPPER